MGVVKKYGGTVFYSDDRIKALAEFIAREYDPNEDLVIVVSALVEESERLQKLGMDFGGDHIDRESHQLISLGEQRTANLLTLSLKAKGVPAISLNGFQLGIRTSDQHGKAVISSVNPTRIYDEINKGKVVVATGFQGIDENGDITTFGANYGGSDLTAVTIAIAMNYECELYKGVKGVYTIDPEERKDEKVIPQIGYSEMMLIASCGANIIEPKAVELAEEFGLEVYVGQAFEKEKGGTYLMKDSLIVTNKAITALAAQEDIAMCTIAGRGNQEGLTNRIFQALGDADVNLDIIIKQRFDDDQWMLSFSCQLEQMEIVRKATRQMQEEFNFSVTERNGLVVISIIGVGLATASGVAVKAFKALAQENIDILNVTTSEISISYVLEGENKTKGIVALCQAFGL